MKGGDVRVEQAAGPQPERQARHMGVDERLVIADHEEGRSELGEALLAHHLHAPQQAEQGPGGQAEDPARQPVRQPPIGRAAVPPGAAHLAEALGPGSRRDFIELEVGQVLDTSARPHVCCARSSLHPSLESWNSPGVSVACGGPGVGGVSVV